MVSPSLNSGMAWINIHLCSLAIGLKTPITTFSTTLPVCNATIEGCSSPGKSVPSSWMLFQRGSTDVLPIIWFMDRPSICCAAGLADIIFPSASWYTTPCAIVSNKARNLDSLSSNAPLAFSCSVISAAMDIKHGSFFRVIFDMDRLYVRISPDLIRNFTSALETTLFFFSKSSNTCLCSGLCHKFKSIVVRPIRSLRL